MVNLCDKDNLRAEYQAILDALKSTKNQQWLISTYVLALQIGLVKLFIDTKGLIDKSNLNHYIGYLRVGTWVISIMGIALIIMYLCKIYEYRKKKNGVLDKLGLDTDHRVFDVFESIIMIIFVVLYFGLAIIISSFLSTQWV